MDIRFISLDEIHLDERNPRILHLTEGTSRVIDQELIKMALGASAPEDEEKGAATTYSSLKASIRAYKGLINPIIVSPRGGGGYVVIEGNTRVAIYNELNDHEADGDWSRIPAVVQEAIEEEGEHAIRLQAHLVGPRPWRPYAKAKYLHDLYSNRKLSLSQIHDFCGGSGRKREIEDYINAYEDMQDTFVEISREQGAPVDYRKFSSFVEIQSKKSALARAGYTLLDFAQWVFDNRFGRQEEVRQLPRILSNPEAKRQFLAHNVREALKVLDQPNPTAVIGSASLEQLALALTVKIRQINFSEVQALASARDDAPAQALLTCLDELKALTNYFGQNADA